jgi:MoxR-like ATPase
MNTQSFEKIRALRAQLDKVVSGYAHIKDAIIVALLADGHVLLEAVPGTAKTTLVNTLQKAIADSKSARIQMTPDQKPTDILGTEIFNLQSGQFVTRTGPMIGANILLADEINRTTPKTLSATLQAMQERKVTIGNDTFDLEELFIMLATMNPVEQEGTYSVPEATLDRFAVKLIMEYVSRDDEVNMLGNTVVHGRDAQSEVEQVISVSDILEMRLAVNEIASRATRSLREYIVDLCRATRPGTTVEEKAYFDKVHGTDAALLREQIQYGTSPRAMIWTLHCAAAVAFIEGADHIEPDHVKAVFRNVARHRIILSDLAISEEHNTDEIIDAVLARVPVIEARA